MRVMTSRFHNKKIAEMDVVPVAIALGVPKFPLGFEVKAVKADSPGQVDAG